ncbi:MAG: DUF1622 domain-containing protein [Proteobacteria bacterium]|nr:DUF1622 domain-containing protein [Pseudomonadota bacterium]
MDWSSLQSILLVIKHIISLIGFLIIFSGVLVALYQYVYYAFSGKLLNKEDTKINLIRLNLGRILILGLEFIVAADLIGTMTTPGYYEVGILAIIVLIRTFLNFSINKELMAINKEA